MNFNAKLTVLGARGSAPVSGKEYARYGGATTCFRLDCADCTVFLDAGTGLLRSGAGEPMDSCHILLTHPHMDHLYGLPLFLQMFMPESSVTLWGAKLDGRSVREQLECLMYPPLWPVTSRVFKAKTEFCSFMAGETLRLSPRVWAETLMLNHPGGCTAYKLHVEDRTMVFATDVELTPAAASELAAFAGSCDLLILDAQYTDEEYKARIGFGHSSISQSLALVSKCLPRSTLLTHHDPYRTDEELDELARTLPENVRLAKEGMETAL